MPLYWEKAVVSVWILMVKGSNVFTHTYLNGNMACDCGACGLYTQWIFKAPHETGGRHGPCFISPALAPLPAAEGVGAATSHQPTGCGARTFKLPTVFDPYISISPLQRLPLSGNM